MKIDPQRVEQLFIECLANAPEDRDLAALAADSEYTIVEGIMHTTGFSTEKLESHRAEIVEMLSWLPTDFRDNVAAGGGGGWSFLNACEDREGVLWGSHPVMDQLFQLGIGLGVARWLLPRKFWPALPGGMPYVSVTVD